VSQIAACPGVRAPTATVSRGGRWSTPLFGAARSRQAGLPDRNRGGGGRRVRLRADAVDATGPSLWSARVHGPAGHWRVCLEA